MLKKKGFSNYQKWELYESSTDEEDQGEPILPRNDPNFLAMEKDMMETQRKRETSRNKALALKDEGNKMMNEGKFKKAIKCYTDAIEEFRSLMILYTNRALAYIRVEEYENAIADCNKVIEYLDIFEEELTKNKELYAKALSRKAICLEKMKNYEEALEVIEKAVEFIGDEDVLKLKKNIEIELELHNRALSELKGDEKQFNSIKQFINLLRIYSMDKSNSEFSDFFLKNTLNKNTEFERIKIVLKLEDNNKLFFVQNGGLEIILSQVKNFPILLEIIKIFMSEKKYVLLLNSLNTFNKLISHLFQEQEPNTIEENKISNTKDIKNLVSILEDASHFEEVRKSISTIKYFKELFLAALTRYDITNKDIVSDMDSVMVLMHFFTFVCNICYSSPEIRSKIASNFIFIVEKITIFLSFFDFSLTSQVNLLESIASFLTNGCNDHEFRNSFINETKLMKEFIVILKRIVNVNSKAYKNYDDLYEKLVSILYNLSYQDNLNQFYNNEGVPEILKDFLFKIYPFNLSNDYLLSLIRTLMLSAKISKIDIKHFLNTGFYKKVVSLTNTKYLNLNSKIVDNSIKILAHLLSEKTARENTTIDYLQEIDFSLLSDSLSEIFLNDFPNLEKDRERFINTMSLMISMIGWNPSVGEKIYNIVDKIIIIAKEKTDLYRKNAAILLARIAKSSQKMEDYVRELHGMDVLVNVAKFIDIKK
jgi:tetratricopeptide (TPR) repeat protein